jgi:hypothetical protein
MTDLHTHSGSDVQTVTFDTAGQFNLVVTILGTGIDLSFDTTQSRTAQTAITVEQQLPAAAAADGNNTTTDSTATPTEATTTSNDTTTTTTPSSGIELSPQPIWVEGARNTGMAPINETHRIATFVGNGTMTVPDTGETINMTNNGTAIISPVAGSADTIGAYGREYVFSEEDGDTTAITFYEIVQYQPEPIQGKGLIIAVFDRNATGSLAPFNGMMVAGTHEEQPNAQGTTITLWEWEGGIGNNTGVALPPLQSESPMNTTTTKSP